MTIHNVALIGFGEVGRVLATGLPPRLRVAAYDSVVTKLEPRGRATACASAAAAVKDADLVISAVTAAQTVAAAEAVSAHLRPGAWYLDLNSASPASKIAAAAIIEGSAGRYVEAAVMVPIAPKGLAAPMLLGGPHAEVFASLAASIGLADAIYFSDIPGKAAATKLCRSVMIKGLEALISESLLAARHYGVEDTVLESLNNLFPHPDWSGYARYMISRTVEHGARRAEEMHEAARTVAETGVTPWMSEAAALRQAWAAGHAEALGQSDLKTMLDVMRAITMQEAAQ